MILDLLARARGGRIEIAPGCFVTYELETIDILGGLVRPPTTDALRRYYEDFVDVKQRNGATFLFTYLGPGSASFSGLSRF